MSLITMRYAAYAALEPHARERQGLSTVGSLLLRFFRVLRILRLAKLGRMSRAWHDLSQAVTERRHELSLTISIAGIVLLVASTLMYWAEAGAQPDKFGNIPRAMWWCIVTLTTVGYGDAYPVTLLGKSLAGLVAIAGIGLIAMPTGILAAAFSDVVQRRRAEAAEAKSSKRRKVPCSSVSPRSGWRSRPSPLRRFLR